MQPPAYCMATGLPQRFSSPVQATAQGTGSMQLAGHALAPDSNAPIVPQVYCYLKGGRPVWNADSDYP